MLDDKYIGSKEASNILGVSQETLISYLHEGELKGIKLPGGAYRFSTKELEQFMKSAARTNGGQA